MIQVLKKFGVIFVLAFAFATFFSSCEKDLYENQISTYQKSQMNNVRIDEVPFLIPHLEKYDRKYSFLKNAGLSYRSIEDLDLELDKIIEYVETNGLKSYSVAIKSSFENSDDFYFENLHIIKINGDYHPFIARYNATNDSKAFNAATFTGKIELFTVDKKMAASMDLLNGQKLADPSPPTNFDDPIGGSGSEDPGPPSWMPTWLLEFLGWWNGLDPSSNVSTTNNTPSNGGVFIGIAESGYPVTMGDQPIIPNNNTGGSGGSTNTIAPNEPEWTYPISSFLMESLIKSRFGDYTNQQIDLWLDNDANNNLIDQVYFYMAEGGNDPEVTNFALNMVYSMINKPGVFSSINPFLIEKQINDNNLNPCAKSVLNQLKNLQQNDIATIIAKFDNPSTVYQLNFASQTPPINPINSAENDWVRDTNGEGIDNNYSISINPTFENQATLISIARTLLHEILHAYILSYIDNLNLSVPVNPTEFPIIYQAAINNTYNNNPNQLQHIQISRKFIIPLRDALKELDNSSQPLQYYEDLAWGALEETSTFNILYPINSIDRDRILATNHSEDTNSSSTSGSQTITPISNPCN